MVGASWGIPSTVNTSDAGKSLLKQFESLRLESYLDSVAVATIGWGHTGPTIKLGMTITEEVAEAYLSLDLLIVDNGLRKLVVAPVTQNQWDALASFAFNLGLGALGGSTLLKLVNAGKPELAAKEFAKWDHAGGKELAGLEKRRVAEATLFSA